MSKVSEFIKTPKTHEELCEMSNELTGLSKKKSKALTPKDNELWTLVYDYLDFHANRNKPSEQV